MGLGTLFRSIRELVVEANYLRVSGQRNLTDTHMALRDAHRDMTVGMKDFQRAIQEAQCSALDAAQELRLLKMQADLLENSYQHMPGWLAYERSRRAIR